MPTMTDDSGELEAYVDNHRADLIDLALELLAVNTAIPPGDTREVVALLEDTCCRFRSTSSGSRSIRRSRIY